MQSWNRHGPLNKPGRAVPPYFDYWLSHYPAKATTLVNNTKKNENNNGHAENDLALADQF